MPFLLVRMFYGVFSAFAPSTIAFYNGHQIPIEPSNSGLSKFSSASPQWDIYLVMSALMEWIAVIIYLAARLFTPLNNDRRVDAGDCKDDGDSHSSEPDVFCLKAFV